MTVIVKGNKLQAAQAASDRGIPFVFVSETDDPWTVGKVGQQFHDKVAEWFIELPHKAPYPVGACLHYTLGDN